MTTITNPLGVHALVWVGDTSPASVSQAISQTRDAGFDLLELSLHDADNLDIAAARSELTEAGLQVACSRGLAFDADVSSDDPAVVARGEALLHESLQITHDLGGTHLTGALYSPWASTARRCPPRGGRNVVTVLQGLAKEARDPGHDPRAGDLQPLRDQRHQHRPRRAAAGRRHRRRQRPRSTSTRTT